MLVYAHRGASGHAPENTLASFRKAAAMGARAVELDVHQTADHELVVAHDDDLRRCGRDRRRLGALRWADAAKVDVGAWFDPAFKGERPPRLEDVYAALPPSVEVNVELKHGSKVYPGIEERALGLVRRLGAEKRTLFSSFDHAALRRLRERDAQARIGYLLGLARLATAFAEMKELAAEGIHCSVRQLTRRMIKGAHERGWRVNVYTVNTPAERDRLARLGVDGIFTNYPELDLWRP